MALNTQYRTEEPEIMDDFSLQHQEIDPVLKELEVINKLLGGFSVFYHAFKKIKLANGDLICDWGCGGGDSLLALRNRFKKKNLNLKYLGLDATKTAVEFAKHHHLNYQEITFKEVDVLKEKFEENQYNVVISSLFTHHFEDEDWTELRKQAHQILSPARLFGMNVTAELLLKLEKDTQLSKDEMKHLVSDIVDQIQRSGKIIRDQVKRLEKE